MRTKYSAIFFGLFVVAAFFSCENKSSREQSIETGPPEEAGPFKPDFQGRLYTSGLSREEADLLQLAWPVYQITGSENFFFSGNDSLQSWIGRCTGVKGEMLKGWKGVETINGQFAYNRGAIKVTEIKVIPFDSCSRPEVPEQDRIIAGTRKLYKGTAERMQRPAPDIAYDYSFRLSEPFRDEFNQTEPNKLITELPLEVYAPEVLNEIEKSIRTGTELLLEAVFVHGYAESPALHVVKAEELKAQGV